MQDSDARTTSTPAWVQEALREGEATDGVPNKRAEPRLSWHATCTAKPLRTQDLGPFSVRVFNVSSGGLGVIARRRVEPGERLLLTPLGAAATEAVRVRVIHCTQTVQGYKIGCAFDTA